MASALPPFVQAYRFNPVSGWGTKYSDPASGATFNVTSIGIAFAPQNKKLVVVGHNSSDYSNYEWTYASGFGSRTAVSVANTFGCAFTKDGNRLLIAGNSRFSEFAYDPTSGVGAEVAGVNAGSGFRSCLYIWDDEFTVAGSVNLISIYNRSLSTQISSHSLSGTPTVLSQSPITHSGTRMLAISRDGNSVILLRIDSNGLISSVVTSTLGSTVHAAVFDPYGRLIVGGSSNLLRIYTIDSAGNQTLLSTASDFSGGTARAFVYDEDRDILFVGSTTTPFITAYRMGGSGFVSKFSNPASLPNASIRGVSLMYDEAWKS
jgi:hypothetical protein